MAGRHRARRRRGAAAGCSEADRGPHPGAGAPRYGGGACPGRPGRNGRAGEAGAGAAGARTPAGGPRRGPLRAALVLAGDDDWRGRGARSVSPRPLPPAAAPHRGGAGPGRPPRHVRGGGRARGVGGSEPRRAAGSAAGPCDRSHRGGGGAGLLASGDTVVAADAVAAEATRLVEVLRRHHREHPLDPGMSLQALRAAVGAPAPPAAVVDAVLERGVRERQFEIAGSVARAAGWRPALDAHASDARERLARRLAEAAWQVPTIAELEREFAGVPVRALLSHLARDGAAEQMDQERYAAKPALAEFRSALEAALAELGSATPAELRDRFRLTRKYLIPLLEWADRRGVTRRSGDARVLGPLTAGKGDP